MFKIAMTIEEIFNKYASEFKIGADKNGDNTPTDRRMDLQDFEKAINTVHCCKLLEDLQLKLIAMSCFAQEHYNEKAYDVTQITIDEIRTWIKKKRSQHCS